MTAAMVMLKPSSPAPAELYAALLFVALMVFAWSIYGTRLLRRLTALVAVLLVVWTAGTGLALAAPIHAPTLPARPTSIQPKPLPAPTIPFNFCTSCRTIWPDWMCWAYGCDY